MSVDEYIFPEKEVKKSSVRRRLDAQLDKLNDRELSVIEATVNGLCMTKESEEYNPLVFFCPFLVGLNTVSIDGAASNRILSLFYLITGISFYDVDNSVFAFLYNTYMIG